MDVPFEWDISELNQIAKVRKDDVKKAKAEAASSTEKIDSTKKEEEPPSAISVAVEKKDLAAVLDVLSTENLSIGDFRNKSFCVFNYFDVHLHFFPPKGSRNSPFFQMLKLSLSYLFPNTSFPFRTHSPVKFNKPCSLAITFLVYL